MLLLLVVVLMVNNSSLTSLEIREGGYTCRDAQGALTVRALWLRRDPTGGSILQASVPPPHLLPTLKQKQKIHPLPFFPLSFLPQVPGPYTLWLATPCLQNHMGPLINGTGHPIEHSSVQSMTSLWLPS